MWSLGRVYSEQGESAGHARVLRETQARRPKPDGVGRATPKAGLSQPVAAAAPRRAPGHGARQDGARALLGPAPCARAGDDCAASPAARGAEGAASGRLRSSVSPRALPPEDTCVTRRTPAPLRLKVCFWGSRCTPKGSLRTPQGARGLGARRQAPPSAAVAAACGLLSLSHGQVTQRGAAAATAAAPEDSAPRPFATGPRPSGPRPLR